MGNSASTTHFSILNSAKAEQELAKNEVSDGFESKCLRCEKNRRAAQFVEPCSAPENANERLLSVQVPEWLKSLSAVRVAFFREGLPHTRAPNTIWLPYDWSISPNYKETLIHELIHIHQRRNPHFWKDLYGRKWEMVPFIGKLPAEIEERRRFNPDTIQAPLYIWRDEWIPVAVFLRPDAPHLREIRLLFIHKTGGWQAVPPSNWINFFGTRDASICEHPHEMAAYMLTQNSISHAKNLAIEFIQNQ